MNRALRSLIVACAATALGGCFDVMGPGGITTLCFPCQAGSPAPATAFALSPDSAYILRGDTIHFYTWSCTGGYVCGWGGNERSNWSIGGGAAVAVFRGAQVQTVDNAIEILLQGMTAGSSAISATSVKDTLMVRTAILHVVDSSAITQIDMITAYRADYPVSMGYPRDMTARLRNAAGSIVRGRPIAWSVSDTSILRLDPLPSLGGFESRRVVPRKLGTADVTTTFLGVTAVVRLTVVP